MKNEEVNNKNIHNFNVNLLIYIITFQAIFIILCNFLRNFFHCQPNCLLNFLTHLLYSSHVVAVIVATAAFHSKWRVAVNICRSTHQQQVRKEITTTSAKGNLVQEAVYGRAEHNA